MSVNKEREWVAYLGKIFEAKMEEKSFFIPHITQQFEEQDCSIKLNFTERTAWKALENVCRNFLDSTKKIEKFQ